jgi:uncharacterized protein (DUF1330 family)
MPAYAIVDVRITEPERYPEYAKAVPATIKKYGGRYLVRGADLRPIEGDWDLNRFVVLEFPNMEQLQRWYSSPEYEPLKKLRFETAECRMVWVEGYSPPPGA